MKIFFDFAINKPKQRIQIMGIPADELKLYGSKEAAIAAVDVTIIKDAAVESVTITGTVTKEELETKEE
jgi:hypothetical protein